VNLQPTENDAGPFPHLFSAINVGTLRLRNRIVAASTLTGFAEGGLPSERHVQFYGGLARGGAALIVTESTPVHPTGVSLEREIWGFDPRVVPGLRRIAEVVHREGARVLGQVWHCGRQATSRASGLALWAPSAVACPVNREVPKAMTQSEIRELVEGFARTSAHARQAGFDGVEIAAGHGYLIHQFLSPLSNFRDDAYGGNAENRRRLLFEVLDAIRERCGEDFSVCVRLSADELLPGGFSIEDTKGLVRLLAGRGDVSLLSISAGTHASVGQMVGDWSVPRGNLTYLAKAVRLSTQVPVIVAGRIVEPVQAEAILDAGEADLIGMSRALLADPFWPLKARSGQASQTRPCIACNECENLLFQGVPISCAVNPSLSVDDSPLEPAMRSMRPYRVVVVGGGPAGLEAARAAALRGHRVSLLEAETELGGQVRILLRLANRAEFGTILAFLIRELSRLGVDVRLSCRADRETIEALEPDLVVVTTGSTSQPYAIPNDGSIHMINVEESMTAATQDGGKRLVVVDAGAHHQRLLAAAEFQTSMGMEVHVVTPSSAIGIDISPISLGGILERLRAGGCRVWPLVELHSIRGGNARLQDVPSGRRWTLRRVDRVIVAGPGRPNDSLVPALQGNPFRVVAAGDCVAPRGLQDAIREGHAAGLSLEKAGR
jgi:2,4-dienoyl-CoA reductase-like NADH-dependent reductase (Old Yellow Enzyme family)